VPQLRIDRTPAEVRVDDDAAAVDHAAQRRRDRGSQNRSHCIDRGRLVVSIPRRSQRFEMTSYRVLDARAAELASQSEEGFPRENPLDRGDAAER